MNKPAPVTILDTYLEIYELVLHKNF